MKDSRSDRRDGSSEALKSTSTQPVPFPLVRSTDVASELSSGIKSNLAVGADN